ncbi:MAG: efflux RND transporter periplasmic adaptor subunit [Pedobacter sp.]|nr:efflux RND transporter periplasmic adaptor subunit [Pedobacter sp.]
MKQKYAVLILLSASTLFVACGNKDKSAGGKPGAPTGTQVYPVIQIEPQATTLNSDYPATIEGIQDIEIRPKVDGFIEHIYVDEGAMVNKGQLLFKIKAPQYEQEVRTAAAAIRSAEANVDAAKLQVNKTKPLVDKDIISKYELDAAQLALQSKQAALTQAKAALANAKVNLGYTAITSPVAGIVGSIPFKTGSLVSSSNAQPLTTVSNTTKIYAYFSLNEKQLLDFSKTYKGNTLREQMKNMPPVELILADGSIFDKRGCIESFNSLLNKSTGSARLRATFSNPSALLKSGGSALVRIPTTIEKALLIPQKSTVDLQGKKFVYVLGDSAKAISTEIEIMDLTKDKFYVVTKGLKPGQKIVFEGFQGLKDGTKIKPQEKNVDSVYKEIRK